MTNSKSGDGPPEIPDTSEAPPVISPSSLLREAAGKSLGCSRSVDELLHELQIHQVELEMQNEALREAQVTLEESRNRYVDFYDFSPVGYVTLNGSGVITEINLTGAMLFGVQREHILKRRFAQFAAPECVDRWHRYFASVLREGTKQPVELALLRAGGTRLYVQLDCLRLLKEGKAPVVRVALTDISERKYAEAALSEQEEFFRLIAENLGDFIAVLDLAGRRLYNSPSYRRFFGDPNDLLGTDSFAEIHPDDRARVMQAFTETVHSGVGQPMDFRFVLADGRVRQMESRGGVIRDAEGRVARVVVISRDVTEQKEIEQQLRIAATAFEAQEGMFVTDANAVILRVNRAFTEMTGYSAEEAVGETPHLLYSGHHDAAFYCRMWECINRAGAWQGEIWNRRKSGEVYPEWLNITAVKDRAGVLTHYVGTMMDITQRKASEEEIRFLAFYDHLTGLPNRRLLMDRLQQALVTSARSGRAGAVLFVDLDNFKELNDTYGHDQGDILLQQVSRRLSACVREGDTVARMGGDEFVIILEELSEVSDAAAAQAEAVGNKILFALNQLYDLAGQSHRSTPSIGIALFRAQNESIETLLKHADLAMYQAKSAGRNTLRFYSDE